MASWYNRPLVFVRDVAAALDFYIGKLGFAEAWRHVEGGTLLIAQVDRGGMALILTQQWPQKAGQSVNFVSLEDPTPDRLRTELEAQGVEVTDGRWGYRLAVVADPDGNQLWFPYPDPPP